MKRRCMMWSLPSPGRRVDWIYQTRLEQLNIVISFVRSTIKKMEPFCSCPLDPLCRTTWRGMKKRMWTRETLPAPILLAEVGHQLAFTYLYTSIRAHSHGVRLTGLFICYGALVMYSFFLIIIILDCIWNTFTCAPVWRDREGPK